MALEVEFPNDVIRVMEGRPVDMIQLEFRWCTIAVLLGYPFSTGKVYGLYVSKS